MLSLLEHTPDLYLDEIQEQLADVHELEVSLATISRTLKRLGLNSKKVSKACLRTKSIRFTSVILVVKSCCGAL
jgi:arginine repressor